MKLYTVKTSQIILASFLSAMISAGSIVVYFQWKEKQDLPQVVVTADNKCAKVINYKNGDAYNCEDVDVVLRNYKIVMDGPKTTPAGLDK